MAQIVQFPRPSLDTYDDYLAAHARLRQQMRGRRRAERQRAYAELLAAFHERQEAMAALDGRPVQTKAEQKAEWERRKAERKGGTASRESFKRKAVPPVTDADIEHWVKQAKDGGLDADKVRRWCEEMRGRYTQAGSARFFEMLMEEGRKGAFNSD